MMGKYSLRLLLLTLLFLGVRCYAFSQAATQADQVERLWYNEGKTAKIQIYKAANGKFYGKVVWLKIPQVDGQDKIDIHNPDKKMRKEPIMGLQILKGFTKDGTDGYEDGTIYDPSNGKTYSCKMTYKGETLSLRGYYGISLIGKTTIWSRAD